MTLKNSVSNKEMFKKSFNQKKPYKNSQSTDEEKIRDYIQEINREELRKKMKGVEEMDSEDLISLDDIWNKSY